MEKIIPKYLVIANNRLHKLGTELIVQGMITLRISVIPIVFFLNLTFVECKNGIFQNTEFYYAYAQDLDEVSAQRIIEILNKGVIDLWKRPKIHKGLSYDRGVLTVRRLYPVRTKFYPQ